MDRTSFNNLVYLLQHKMHQPLKTNEWLVFYVAMKQNPEEWKLQRVLNLLSREYQKQ